MEEIKNTTNEIRLGDRVVVTHLMGQEFGSVCSIGPNDPRITVRFDDRTQMSFDRSQIQPA